MKADASAKLDLAQRQMQASQHQDILDGVPEGANKREKIRELSEKFESIFLKMMLKSMRQSVPESKFMDGGNAEDIYRSMLDKEYAEQMASERTTGLADTIEDYLLRSMEGSGISSAAKDTGKARGIQAYKAQGLQSEPKQGTINDDG